MCGIVGYIGDRDGGDIVVSGLKALEYRGYDSAGVALIDPEGQARLYRQVGRVSGVEKLLEADKPGKAGIAIGHTRWATHGKPSELNAHPQANGDRSIFVVHNGIIENYAELRDWLGKKGYEFTSETDTEVVPHLIDYYQKKTGSFEKAFVLAIADIRGAYAIVAMSAHDPHKLFAARLSSPMVIGVGKNECIIASDPSAISPHTKKVVYIRDDDMAVVEAGKFKIRNLQNDKAVRRDIETLEFDADKVELGDNPHFMIKEIFESPETLRLASVGRVHAATNTVKLGGLENVAEQLKHIDRIAIVACGTSSYAGLIGELLIEELAGIPVEVHIGSEFKYRKEPFSRGTALVVISQSGETADTIAAVKKVEKYGTLCLGIVNAPGSTLARITHAGVYCHAGPELAVASTKAFISQVLILLEIALFLSKGNAPHYHHILEEIEALPAKAEALLANAEDIKQVALKYKDARDFMFIGRRYSYPVALEGTLKLKETALIHAEGFPAGELKHGPLALIDKDFPTFALIPDDPMLEKTLSNVQEIKARGGPVVAVATEGDTKVAAVADDVIYIPKTLEYTSPILQGIVVQLFSYYIAAAKSLNVDRPRNLAKSVTVE